jgi:hypothetical protein
MCIVQLKINMIENKWYIFNYILMLLNQTASHESLITIKKIKSYCLLVLNTICNPTEGAIQRMAKVQCSNWVELRWDSSIQQTKTLFGLSSSRQLPQLISSCFRHASCKSVLDSQWKSSFRRYYALAAERSSTDCLHPHLLHANTLPFPAYASIFPSSCLLIFFTLILEVINLANDKHFGLAGVGQKGLGDIEWQEESGKLHGQ